MTLFHGSSSLFFTTLVLLIFLQLGIMNKKNELRYEIKKTQKEYSIILQELEEKNKMAIQGVVCE